MKTLRTLITAILAVLMLAGALCAISGAPPTGSYSHVRIVGEGASPLPVLLSSGMPENQAGSSTQF